MPSHSIGPLSVSVRAIAPSEDHEPHSNGATESSFGTDEGSARYQFPPKEILDIVDAPPTPALSFSPKRDKILFLQRRSLPRLADLARPEVKLAGLRIDAAYTTRSRMSSYTGISICKLLNDGTLGPELNVGGLPIDPEINYVSWSPDGAYLAFTVRRVDQEDGVATGLGLWVADTETGQARELNVPPKLTLNPVYDPFLWVDALTLVVFLIPSSRGSPPKKPVLYKVRNFFRKILSHSMARLSVSVRATAPSEDHEPHSNGATESSFGTDEGSAGYQFLPKEIPDIVDAPPTPALSFSPKRDKILFLQRRSLPRLADLARPEVKLAGLRIDAAYTTRSRMSSYTGISICKLLNDGTLGPELNVGGLPIDPEINYVSWSPDGAYLAFTVRRVDQEDGVATGLGLWVADTETGQARELNGPPKLTLNPVYDTFSWVDASTLVVFLIPPSRGSPPKQRLVPFGPNIQSDETNEVVQSRSYQDLLKDAHDEKLFEYYATAQIGLVSLGGETKLIGNTAVYTSVDPSPDGEYFLVSSIHRPYSFIVASSRFPKKTELWEGNGEFVIEIRDIPLAEEIPIIFDSVRQGRRSLNWRADRPSLYWFDLTIRPAADGHFDPLDLSSCSTYDLKNLPDRRIETKVVVYQPTKDAALSLFREQIDRWEQIRDAERVAFVTTNAARRLGVKPEGGGIRTALRTSTESYPVVFALLCAFKSRVQFVALVTSCPQLTIPELTRRFRVCFPADAVAQILREFVWDIAQLPISYRHAAVQVTQQNERRKLLRYGAQTFEAFLCGRLAKKPVTKEFNPGGYCVRPELANLVDEAVSRNMNPIQKQVVREIAWIASSVLQEQAVGDSPRALGTLLGMILAGSLKYCRDVTACKAGRQQTALFVNDLFFALLSVGYPSVGTVGGFVAHSLVEWLMMPTDNEIIPRELQSAITFAVQDGINKFTEEQRGHLLDYMHEALTENNIRH